MECLILVSIFEITNKVHQHVSKLKRYDILDHSLTHREFKW
uniref:Uncharacterized protein n=1 Tax=Arundo donax TaxID=35708 RepID=A0A0A8ZIY4_ARUDO